MKEPISVTILTKNSQAYLREVLEALIAFDEVLICDTGSHDSTMEIAGQYPNVTLYERPFTGFGPTHNTASNLARNNWILSVDSDEIVTPELAKEINDLYLKKGCVYSFPRHNEYRGKWIKWCGWHPDRVVRLYNRLDTSYNDAQVHESIIAENVQIIPLESALRHYSYAKVADFLAKMQSYSDLFAAQYQGKKSSSLGKAISHGLFAFFKSYILKKGFMGGREGFEISFYNANTAFYKYLKLAEANQKLNQTLKTDAEKCGDAPMKTPPSANP